MNKNRKFLVALTALASVFVSTSASAIPNTDYTETLTTTADANKHIQSDEAATANPFSFILKRSNEATLMAAHGSHQSHSSHRSHRSHYSGS